jgi:serine phosphatase RsbU (regulator of sigma subunit)
MGSPLSLRTRLILAFLLMAVVPLLGVTVFSYLSTRRAFESVVAAETASLTEEMERRMEAVKEDLHERLGRLGTLPLGVLLEQEGSKGDRSAVLGRLQDEIGPAGGLIESLEVVPEPAAPETAPSPGAPTAPPPPPPVVLVPPVPPAEAVRRVAPAPWLLGRGTEEFERVEPSVVQQADDIRTEVMRELERETARLSREIAREARRTARQRAGRDDETRDLELERKAIEAAHAALAGRAKEMKLLLGREFLVPLIRSGARVGRVRAQVKAGELVRALLARTAHGRGELPFAIDSEGTIYAADPRDEPRVAAIVHAPAGSDEAQDWVVATRRDETSGLTLGIARPIGEPLRQMRRTALLNLLGGLVIVGLALLAVIPLSRRMTADLATLAEGAERIGQGDLEARVPVRGARELARLADRFNHMAAELKQNQHHLLAQERLRKELEISRRIQEELLPRAPLVAPGLEIQGVSVPAREVGGDFFNYFELDGGQVVVVMGDVSGKGVPAALLMGNVQATLRATVPREPDLAVLCTHLDEELDARTPRQAFVTLFVGVLDPSRGVLRWVSAGHITQYLVGVDRVVALDSTGRPLALLPGGGYEARELAVQPGDCLFLFTDGLVESENEAGEPFGFDRVPPLLAEARAGGAADVLAHMEAAVRAHRGAHEADDDATMLVVKLG